MRRIFLIILSLFAFVSCDEINSNQQMRRDTVITEETLAMYVVEEKEYGYYMLAGSRYLVLSNIKTHELRRVEVGKYTFSQINVGDTIEWRK